MNPLRGLSDNAKGILLISGGTILLLNNMHIISINALVTAGAIVMIVMGAILSKAHKKILGLFKKHDSI